MLEKKWFTMNEIQEIRLCDTLRRYDNLQSESTIPEVFLLACSLTEYQRELFGSIISASEDESGAELSILRQCLIKPHALLAAPPRALFVIDRHMDSKLYSKHVEGPAEPIEPVNEDVGIMFPHVKKYEVVKK